MGSGKSAFKQYNVYNDLRFFCIEFLSIADSIKGRESFIGRRNTALQDAMTARCAIEQGAREQRN